ncbi:MAG: substrate-binding domain-containing protein [Planctomycetaceae bacterium]|nr:substrate-binding domain-containing protein [Planctomycetaceae bacterium]
MITIGLYLDRLGIRSHRVIEGILQYVDEHSGIQLKDFLFEADHTLEEDDYFTSIPPWKNRVDGVIASVGKSEGLVEWMERGDVPIVMVCGDLADSGLPSVYTDGESIAKIAVEHIKSLQRHYVGYVGYRDSDGSHHRRDALADFCRQEEFQFAAYEMDIAMAISHSELADSMAPDPKLMAYLQQIPKPATIVTLNDQYAIATLKAIHTLGFSVPEDIAVIGVDDSETSRLHSIPLTSIHPPNLEIGYEATRLLMRLTEHKRLGRKIVEVPAERISIRESTIGQQRAPVTDIDRAREYIRLHACEGIRVCDVADHVHIPLRTFQIEFKEATNRTVSEEIREVRFHRACELLQTTDFTLDRIAHLVGMSHAASFSEFFRKAAGMTPNSYRNQYTQA